MTPEEYEQLVSALAESVVRKVESLPVGAIQTGRKNRWRGASGYEHQIDVSIRGERRTLLVECKYWDKRVPLDAVLVLQARLDDIRPTLPEAVVEGSIVSKVGFSRHAKRVSEHFGIHCDLVKSAEEFGFKYAGHLFVRPRDASLGLDTRGPIVTITSPGPPSADR